MSKRYSANYPVTVSVAGDEAEFDCKITFAVDPYIPASMDGPAEGGTLEILTVTLRDDLKTPLPIWLFDKIAEMKGLKESLLEEAGEQDAEARDYRAEMRAERMA